MVFIANNPIHGVSNPKRNAFYLIHEVIDAMFGIPDAMFGVPDAIFGVSDVMFGVPDVMFGVPDVKFGVPDAMYGVISSYLLFFLVLTLILTIVDV